MTKFKKWMILGVVVALGAGFLLTNNLNNTEGTASEKDQSVVFGSVDYSDDEDYDDYEDEEADYKDEDDSDDEADNDDSWLENFIDNHETPFSKKIDKE